jgi:shikimate dehydrogenase
MTPNPGRLALLGHPVSHSLSPRMMGAAIRAAGIDATYDAIDVTPADLPAVVRRLRRDGYGGNVTIPHKKAVALVCDRQSDAAELVGAVNTFWMDASELVGHNTDVAGFDRALRALTSAAAVDGLPRSVALLGAGGGAAAVLAAVSLWETKVERVWIVARSPESSASLAGRFPELPIVCSADLAGAAEADLVVNATPVGMLDDDSPFRIDRLGKRTIVFDLVYRRGGTRLCREARAAGHIADDGLRMLVEQGAAAFKRWYGFEPDREAMWQAVSGGDSPGR